MLTGQLSVSTLVHELEANLGLRLFDRHTRLLRITQAGAELLPLMKKAVSDIDSVILSSNELKNSGARARVDCGILGASSLIVAALH
ncbi:LysR family transcriptional regulator [Undibacterium arcticum]